MADNWQPARSWELLAALVISGFLLALPGALLPKWGYHITPAYGIAGDCFLALGAGVVGGTRLARKITAKLGLPRLLALGCAASAVSIAALSFAAPPAQVWYQALALLLAGTASGIVNTAVFEAVAAPYEADPALTTLSGGIFFGIGSIAAAIVSALSFEGGGVCFALLSIALLPALAAAWFYFRRIELPPALEASLELAARDLRSGLGAIFAVLLFFQFASEWLIAAWLPIFLIDRMGMSPPSSLTLLAIYWTALTLGRIATTAVLTVASHWRMFAASALCALLGCSLMAYGSNIGIVLGLLLTGLGFSAIYPLAAERIAGRLSYFHAGYFNGIFTFALLGGIISPFVVGQLAASVGLRAVPLTAMIGSIAVFALTLLLWFGRKVAGR